MGARTGGRHAHAGLVAPRRERVEPREPLHGLDGRGPLAAGGGGGARCGEALARRGLPLRRRPHLGAQAGDTDAVDRPRRHGPHVDPDPDQLAAQRAALRGPSGPQQGRDCAEVRRGAGKGLAPQLCDSAPAARAGGRATPGAGSPLRRTDPRPPPAHGVAQGHRRPLPPVLARRDRARRPGRETRDRRRPRQQPARSRQAPRRRLRGRDRRPQHPHRHPARLRAGRRAAPRPSPVPRRPRGGEEGGGGGREAGLEMTAEAESTTAARGLRRRRRAATLGVGVVLVTVLGGVAGYRRLRASLPALDGERALPGLGAPVRVERDSKGVPLVSGRSRLDVARATGFLHAQERFFQMDTLRRRAAGELAELVGAAALPIDREVRVFRLRDVARRTVRALPADQRALLSAYTHGVNAGLAALGASPFEYQLLRLDPAPWRGEDSMLCALAMFLTLQGELPGQESALGLMHDLLPGELFDFLAPKGTEWDAPLEGEAFAQPSVPGPEVFDLRRRPPKAAVRPRPRSHAVARDPLAPVEGDEAVVYGSNNWAVAGAHTAHGGAILANDMHLGISVPNTWYRASLAWPALEGERRVSGVMLPGAPFVVAGSNGRVVWGFTNSQGDWADLVLLEPAAGEADAYLTPEGPRKLERARETIRVKGGEEEALEVLSTIWGPVVDEDHRGRRRALSWVPLLPRGPHAPLFRIESVDGLHEAMSPP